MIAEPSLDSLGTGSRLIARRRHIQRHTRGGKLPKGPPQVTSQRLFAHFDQTHRLRMGQLT